MSLNTPSGPLSEEFSTKSAVRGLSGLWVTFTIIPIYRDCTVFFSPKEYSRAPAHP